MKFKKTLKKVIAIVLCSAVVSSSVLTQSNGIYALNGSEKNVSGFALSLNWNKNNNSTKYTWDSSTDEDKLVRLNVGYSNSQVNKGYEPGELSITVPGIGGANRTGIVEAVDVAADKSDATEKGRDWSYTYDKTNDIYTFTNNKKIDEKSNFSGSFEILWKLNSRDTVHNYSKELQATLNSSDDTVESNTVSFNYTSQKDTYNISEYSSKLSSHDGLGSEYKDYIWVNWNISSSMQTRARGANNLYYYVDIPDDAVVKFVRSNNNDVSYSITKGKCKIKYSSSSIVLTVGYPKDKYNGTEIENPVELTGKYYEETQESVLATTNAKIKINAEDYDFIYDEGIVAIDKSANTSYIRYDDATSGNASASFNLAPTLINPGKNYDIVLFDDILDIQLNDGTFRRLTDDEYKFTSVVIPKSESIKNGNGQGLESNKYDCEIYVRKKGSNDFILFNSVKISTSEQNISLPENTVAIKYVIKDIDVSIKTANFKVNINFHINSDDTNIDKNGFIRNLDAIELYENETLVNNVNKDSYIGSWSEEVANRDMKIYGKYMQRAYADVPFKEDNVYSNWYTGTTIDDFVSSDSVFNTSMSINTNFTKSSGEFEKIEQFSQYTILDKGLEVDKNNFDFSVIGQSIQFGNGQTVSNEYVESHVNVEILNNYRDSKRTYVRFDYDFTDMPIYVKNSTITSKFEINLTDDNYLEYGESYTGRGVSIIHGDTSFIANNSSGNDDGKYFGIDEELWSDLDNDGKTNEIITYRSDNTMIIQALSSYQELQKSVKSEYTDNKYNTSDVSTLLNDSYSYKLKFKTGNSAAKNLVIYDDLETAENSEWKGTFKSIDLSYLEDKGYNPTILYSTIEIPGDISNKNNWSTDKPANDKIKSIAIDFGEEIVQANSLIYFTITMTSPKDESLIGKSTINDFNVRFMSVDIVSGLETGQTALDSNTVSVNLSDPIGSIELIKTDAISGNKLKGAIFTLYDSNGNIIKDDLETNSLGTITVKNIPFGEYYFMEKDAPKGYEISTEKVSVTLDSQHVSVNVKNDRLKGNVQLKKTSSSDKDMFVKGATYALYKESNDTNVSDILIQDNLVTDKNGLTDVVKNLEWGNYYFVETIAAPGYEINSSKIYFIIDKSNVSKTITVDTEDTQIPAILKIIKQDTAGTNISNAYFDLYDSKDNLIAENLKTDENGEIIAGELTYGEYYLIETKNEGYIVTDERIEFTLNSSDLKGDNFTSEFDENGALKCTIVVDNVRKTGNVTLVKTGENDETLGGAVYSLYKNGILLKDDLKSNNEGQISVKELEWGNYYFLEKQAPNGYEKSEEKIEFEVNRNTVETAIIVSAKDKQIKGEVVLTKVDNDDTSIKLKGAVYTLYDSKDSIILDDLESNDSGEIKVDNLEWGSYYFLEKQAPDGYSISDEKVRFSVNAMNASVTQKLIAKDTMEESYQITLTKKIKTDDVWFEHGNPMFIFKLEGKDINGKSHTYYKNVVFDKDYVEKNTKDGYVEKSVIFSGLIKGSYTATELDGIRYDLKEIIKIQNGVLSNQSVVFDFTSNSATEGMATFVNEKTTWKDYSHNDNQTNIIKSTVMPTGISVKSSIIEQKTEEIDRSLLEVTAYYDDGTSRILSNDEYTLNPEKVDSSMNGEFTIIVSYTEKDVEMTDSFIVNVKIPIQFTAYIYNSSNKKIGTYDSEKGMDINEGETPSYAAITGYTGSSSVVVFPATIEGVEVRNIGVTESSTSLKINLPSTVETIKFSEGIENIGNGAFSGMTNLKGDLIMPDSVISIGKNAFYNCKGFNGTLFLGSGLTSIGASVFQSCGFTGDLVIPDSVTSVGDSAFKNCTSLDGTINLGSNLSNIGENTFEYCNKLIGDLVIPDSVTSVGNSAFNGCTGFNGTLNLGRNLSSIGTSVFRNCNNLSGGLVVPNSVTSIGDSAFSNCTSLDGTLKLGSRLSSIGENTFYNCNKLSGDLIMPDSVISIGKNTFNSCKGFKGTLFLGSGLTSIGSSAFQYCGFTGDLVIPDNVVSIGDYAFSSCTGFNGVLKLGNGLKSIGSGVFSSCTNLTGDLIIPDTVTSIGDSAFRYDKGFNGELVIGANVSSIDNRAFEGCTGFKGDLVIPNSVTSIGDYAFSDTNFDGTLKLSSKLKTIGLGAFRRSKLTGELNIPNSVTDVSQQAFELSSFSSISLGNNLTTIGFCAFKDMPNLVGEIILPKSVSNLDDGAFSSEGIESIVVLNEKCSIFRNGYWTLGQNAIIKGYTSSTAKEYADTYGNTFESIDNAAVRNITIDDTSVEVVASAKAYSEVTVTSIIEGKSVSAFKINGRLVEGDTFIMPNEDVSITDIILIDVITVESPHYPYDNNSDKVYYENTFSGAKSITIDLTYGTESDQYDYVAITDADGNSASINLVPVK